MAKAETPSAEVAVRPRLQLPAHLIDPAPLPPVLAGLIDLKGWLRSLTENVDYEPPNPDYMAQRMLLTTLMAPTPEALYGESELDGLQKLIPDLPGQSTGNIVIDDLYVAPSSLSEGSKTYILLTYTVQRSMLQVTTSTGASRLQSTFLGFLAMGVWPIEGQIVRSKSTDRGGRHLFAFYPVDV